MHQSHDNLFRDSLYYLHPDCANDEAHIAMGRGQICGIVSVVMAMGNYNFEQAVAYVAPHLPEKIVWACIPEAWHGEFLRQGALSSVSTVKPGVGEVKVRYARYNRMLGLR